MAGSLAACGSTGQVSSSSTTSTVANHVHAVVQLGQPGQILLGTHYGLRESMNGGKTWSYDPGLGHIMVAALVKLTNGYVASLQPMGDMSGSSSMGSGSAGSSSSSTTMAATASTQAAGSMGGMSMSGTSMGSSSGSGSSANIYQEASPNIPYIEVSSDGQTWQPASGVPSQALIGYLTAGPNHETAWAAVLGSGIYHSKMGGTTWKLAIPYNGIVTGLSVGVGAPNQVLISTKQGLFATTTTATALPAKPVLAENVESLHRWYACSSCLVASLTNGGVAVSRDGGLTWSRVGSLLQFDTVVSFPSTGAALFGMIATAGSSYVGVYRSTDGGNVWSRVLNQQLVDQMSEVDMPGMQPYLLAYQWGITVWKSTNEGQSWTKLGRV